LPYSGHINHLFLSSRGLRATRKYPGLHDRKEKRLDVVLLGNPNAGKSVLLNELLQTKLAATSRKRQTTRTKILGVFNYHKTQLAFYDIPGFVPSHAMGKEEVRRLRQIITSTVALADVVVLVIDAAKACNHIDIHDYSEMIRMAFDGASQEVILVLNKVDLVTPKSKLLDVTYDIVSIINGVKLGPEGAQEAMLDTTTFMVSATENDGVIDLKNYLLAAAKPKQWVIPAHSRNAVTNIPDEERVEEMVREMLLDHTHEEVPYVAGITCQSIRSMTPQKLRVDVDILVDNHRQQRIVVGDKGRTLVKIRQTAVEALEGIFNKTVILYLWVKIRSKHAEENDEEQLL
jgi:GTPase